MTITLPDGHTEPTFLYFEVSCTPFFKHPALWPHRLHLLHLYKPKYDQVSTLFLKTPHGMQQLTRLARLQRETPSHVGRVHNIFQRLHPRGHRSVACFDRGKDENNLFHVVFVVHTLDDFQPPTRRRETGVVVGASSFPIWNNVPLARLVEERTGRPVRGSVEGKRQKTYNYGITIQCRFD